MTTNVQPLDFNPPYLYPDYRSTTVVSPSKRPVILPRDWFEFGEGPAYGRIPVRAGDNDLVNGNGGRPQGQRIVLTGRVLDSDGRPAPDVLIEIWQANASGRYIDSVDMQFQPVDPYFTGAGRTLTDSLGRFSFRTIRPGAYAGLPGGQFRPSHIHVSVFGWSLSTRLITQCYFEGDPLIAHDAIAQSVGDPRGLDRLIAKLDFDANEPGALDCALAYNWDIVLRGPRATPAEAAR
ncbi:protocatechuate 3,4-dioxygenase subunit beta [Trebonia sp.]|uniref:dioxygenase family protein n=1 Tax=Trebonia sp. TaxID=2767075 RepID=UPI002609E739|nr:protocatechuate 3,4-dioxygenase subunit beta [Trebonia sp.]